MNKKIDLTITMYNNMEKFHKVEEKKPTRKWRENPYTAGFHYRYD